MKNYAALLQKIRLAADSSVPELAAGLLRLVALELDDGGRSFFLIGSVTIAESTDCWKDLQQFLSLAFSEPLLLSQHHEEKAASIQTTLEQLYALAEQRKWDRIAIAAMVRPEALPYALPLTNMDKREMGEKLTAIGREIGIDMQLPKTLAEGGMLQAVKELREAIDRKDPDYADESLLKLRLKLEAFEGAARHYFSKQSVRLESKRALRLACAGFCYCSKCWRLLPVEMFSDGTMPLCDEHAYDAQDRKGRYTRYRKAVAIDKEFSESPGFISPDTADILKRLKSDWPVETGEIPLQTWYDAFKNGFADLLALDPKPVSYSLEPVWVVCPHVHAYILEKGGDPLSPASILPILDPFTEYEIAHNFTDARKQLHDLLTRNFSFYRYELALAEAWLAHYASTHAGRTHGGKRQGTGGKRSGAGRKPRQAPK